MNIEQAIRLLHPDTTSEEIAEIEYKYGFRGKEAVVNKINKACRIACKALEKQIPKKITSEFSSHAIYNNGDYIDQLDISTFKCPICGLVLASGEIDNSDCTGIHYCDNCGQALDWDDNVCSMKHDSLCETETFKVEK